MGEGELWPAEVTKLDVLVAVWALAEQMRAGLDRLDVVRGVPCEDGWPPAYLLPGGDDDPPDMGVPALM